jgi:hypothetical protein
MWLRVNTGSFLKIPTQSSDIRHKTRDIDIIFFDYYAVLLCSDLMMQIHCINSVPTCRYYAGWYVDVFWHSIVVELTRHQGVVLSHYTDTFHSIFSSSRPSF